MKNLLLLVALILIGITGCKKDKEEIGPLRKLKEITTTIYQSSKKTTFAYDQNGNLENVKKYIDGVLNSSLEYKYEAGTLVNIKTYVKAATVETFDQVADIRFSYNNNRLSEFSIFPIKQGVTLQPIKYGFEYGNGEIPIKITVSFSDGTVVNSDYSYMVAFPLSPIQYPSYSGSPGGSGITMPYDPLPHDFAANGADFQYQFDEMHNPFYKLPWIDVETLAANKLAFIFDAPGYFGVNNKSKILANLEGTFECVYNNQYEYLSNGQPAKCTSLSSVHDFKTETSYAY